MSESSHRKKYNNPFTATITGISDLFRKQENTVNLLPSDRLEGKRVLVDGASSGLGFAVATECARRGAEVIMACRSGIPGKGEKVEKLTGSGKISMLPVDFSDTDSIVSFVGLVKKSGPVDIYICNAGMVPKEGRMLPNGMEEMFMVNYLSKFIVVNLMIQDECFAKKNNGIPRIIFVSSESHRNPEAFDWDNFGVYHPYKIGKSIALYGYYKLLLTTFAVELSRRMNPGGKTNLSVFALCPGPVNSNIGREAPKIFQPLMKLVFAIFFRSPAKAANPVIYLAASNEEHGKMFDYLFLMSRKTVDAKAADEKNGKKLWDLSEELMNKILHKNN
jgi:NAD(P)-dependent dehydrogenase (short-subunit alcohol dehydrogenase family)